MLSTIMSSPSDRDGRLNNFNRTFGTDLDDTNKRETLKTNLDRLKYPLKLVTCLTLISINCVLNILIVY